MAKRKEKLEEIKIRLTPEEKKIIKDAAASKGITMTQLILDSIVPTAKQYLEFVEHKEIIEERAAAMESKIEDLKGNMKNRRANKKKNKIFNFARKS
ncbi:type II toxin -antitoxin system TacA 1-like antitoxin [Clostridium perfringens]